MELLATLELENALVERYIELNDGVVIHLHSSLVIFVSKNRIGLFDQSTIDAAAGDFSKIPLSKVYITLTPLSSSDEEILLGGIH
jgi:hypothetical protein